MRLGLSMTYSTRHRPLLDSFRGGNELMKIAEYYNYFRDYDPAVGRYLQSDPILGYGASPEFGPRFLRYLDNTFPQVLATYSYAVSSPLRFDDPTGLNPWDWIKCMCYTHRIGEGMKECEKECPKTAPIEDWMKFVRKYGKGPGLKNDPDIDCACTKAGDEVCSKWLSSCSSAPYGGWRGPRPSGGR